MPHPVALPRPSRRAFVALTCAAMTLTGCASWGNKATGTAVGAGIGGLAGGVIDKQTGSTARGAIIGAVVGGAAGMIIGNQMNQQAKELAQDIPSASIARVGEGIAVTFASSLLCDVDSDQVRAEAAKNLRALSSSLGKFPSTDILIVGHTDGTGTADHNQGLSQRRAISASEYLVTQGVAAGRLRSAGRGEMEPIASNDTDGGRQANRRVEIVIVANADSRKNGTQ